MEERRDIGKVEETLLEKELGKAHRDITRYGQDMRAAGITEEQIEGIIAKTQERIQKEFEEKERQDPLETVKKALQEAAQTEDEQFIAKVWCREIDRDKGRLTRYAKNSQQLQEEDPSLKDWRGSEGAWARVTVLSGPVSTAENRKIHIPPEFQKRFLRKLGVLEDDEEMYNLFNKRFPTIDPRQGFVRQPKGPVYERDPKTGYQWVLRIPTNIPGVDIGTDSWQTDILIAPGVLPKIQPKK